MLFVNEKLFIRLRRLTCGDMLATGDQLIAAGKQRGQLMEFSERIHDSIFRKRGSESAEDNLPLSESLRIPYPSVFGFKIFPKKAIDLEQSLARQDHGSVLHCQIAGSFLIGERRRKFVQNIHAKFIQENSL